MMSFDPVTQLDLLVSHYFQALDEFVVATSELNCYLQASSRVEVKKDRPCHLKMMMLNDLVMAMMHTSLLLSGMKHSLMAIETFKKYADGHAIATFQANMDVNLQEMN